MTTDRSKDNAEIDELKRRYDALKTRRTVAETNLENANKQLEQLKQQARDAWGTDDLEELKAKLEQMRKENAERVEKYRQHLDELETNLKAVEAAHAAEGS